MYINFYKFNTILKLVHEVALSIFVHWFLLENLKVDHFTKLIGSSNKDKFE